MSLRCKLGFHSYEKTFDNVKFMMSANKSHEWSKFHFGWYDYRLCKKCNDMQYRRISTSYGRIICKTDWLPMDKTSKRELNFYRSI